MWLALWTMAPAWLQRAIVGVTCLALIAVGFVNRDSEHQLAGWISSRVVHEICVEDVKPIAEAMYAALPRAASAASNRKPPHWCP
jgi:hypothetical protein